MISGGSTTSSAKARARKTALREENIRARVGAILADIGHTKPWELEWWSIYSANTLCLDDYRHGRVFFIGDAAHIVPIFGVRGLNNGLADADNIGWKLALVLNGEADEKLLDSYSPERRGATLDVFANATKSTRFMTPPTRGWRLAREAALSLSLRHEFPRGLANPRQMQPYTYSESPLTPYAGRDAEFAVRTAQRQRRAERQAGRRQPSAGSRRRRHDGDAVLRRSRRTPSRPRLLDATRPARQALCRAADPRPGRGTEAGAIVTATAKSPACSARSPARSICCVPTCTLPDAGRPSFPAKSCGPQVSAWGEPRHEPRCPSKTSKPPTRRWRRRSIRPAREREALFLTRLALVLGHELGDIAAFRKAVGRRAGRPCRVDRPSSRPRNNIHFTTIYPAIAVAIFAAHHMMIVISTVIARA